MARRPPPPGESAPARSRPAPDHRSTATGGRPPGVLRQRPSRGLRQLGPRSTGRAGRRGVPGSLASSPSTRVQPASWRWGRRVRHRRSTAERSQVASRVRAGGGDRCAAHRRGGHHDTRARRSPGTRGARRVPGVVASLAVVPYYVRPSEAGIVATSPRSRRAVTGRAGHLQRPVPHRARTGCHLAAGARGHPDVAGVKQAVGGIDADTLRVLAEAPPSFAVLGGDDAYLLPTS